MLKIIAYNVLIFFVLANVLYWSIPTATLIFDLIKGPRDAMWSPHGGYVFRSFVGWRQPPRPTVNDNTSGDRKTYFFGGSTMWGSGVPNARTIPSQFAAITGMHSENYGELGYTTHQSLL